MKSYFKPQKVKSKALTDSAKGEQCVLNTPVCSHDRETVVFCHAPSEGKGVATKSDDFWGAFGCSNCHQWLDSNKGTDKERQFYWLRGIYRTLKRQFDKGLLKP